MAAAAAGARAAAAAAQASAAAAAGARGADGAGAAPFMSQHRRRPHCCRSTAAARPAVLARPVARNTLAAAAVGTVQAAAGAGTAGQQSCPGPARHVHGTSQFSRGRPGGTVGDAMCRPAANPAVWRRRLAAAAPGAPCPEAMPAAGRGVRRSGLQQQLTPGQRIKIALVVPVCMGIGRARSGSPGRARAYRPLRLGHRVCARQCERAGRRACAPRSRLQRGEPQAPGAGRRKPRIFQYSAAGSEVAEWGKGLFRAGRYTDLITNRYLRSCIPAGSKFHL